MAQNPYFLSPNGYGAPQQWPPQNHAGPSTPNNPYGAAQSHNNASGGYSGYAQYNQAYGWSAPSFGQALFQSTSQHPAPYGESSQSNKRARGNEASGPANGSGSDAMAWRNCSVAGCKYVGPGDQVEIHEQDRHLICPKGLQVERSEEEEGFAKRKGPPPAIEGTNITLQTEEDIAKWVAQRKAKWPSAKRVADKETERQAAIARGDLPARGRGRGGSRGGRGGRRNDPASQAEDWGRPEPELSEIGQRGRGRSRGGRTNRGRDDARGRGRGRGRETGGAEHGQAGRDRPQDNGWPAISIPVQASSLPDSVPPEPSPLNPLATLNAYDTPSESDEDSDASSSTTSSWVSSSGGVEEEEDESVPAMPVPDSPVQGTAKPVCKFFAKNGRCKNGAKCRFAHTLTEQGARHHAPQPKQPQGAPKRTNPFDRPGMLGALLATPIQNTLSQLSQTIRFLVANNMLENVELRPGDADAQARQDNLIVEVKPEVGSETLVGGGPEAGNGE